MEEDWDEEQQVDGDEQQNDEVDDEVEEDEDDDILDMGEDDEANEKEGLLMRFCPHDSSMLYPQVRVETIMLFVGLCLLGACNCLREMKWDVVVGQVPTHALDGMVFSLLILTMYTGISLCRLMLLSKILFRRTNAIDLFNMLVGCVVIPSQLPINP